ncbi:CesT family type III secretion system chaperone [Vibrio europaeus]|uniref:CesT family type III secretion system chaperone n=1 Tax=Vibrio europaeus TaxID=300876 RepID=UPI00233EF622|nr:CesT family type III secretion system chaperone [Vibrio europaeus]MDC5821489.1 CesT family type III secretion system chaperone [Vibrio europaeus]MDC5868487.1 CesT family type III secretion system chaperone [Vibrio europaeus]
MSQQYTQAIEILCHELNLTLSGNIDAVVSFKVGEQECHITEHPAGRLLMFSNLGDLTSDNAKPLLEIGMFSQEEKKPVVGFDSNSNNVILWNHQSLIQADRHSLYQQLDLLSQYYDQVQSDLQNTNSLLVEPEANEKSNFSPAAFRV